MEHSLHLAARHFVEGVSPTSSHQIIRKVHNALAAAGGGDVDMDALDQDLSMVEGDEEGEGDDSEGFEVGDVVGKALALVNQVGITTDLTTI